MKPKELIKLVERGESEKARKIAEEKNIDLTKEVYKSIKEDIKELKEDIKDIDDPELVEAVKSRIRFFDSFIKPTMELKITVDKYIKWREWKNG